MKIILTESQYNKLTEQQSSCPPRIVTKPVIDSVLPQYKSELTSRINGLKSLTIKKLGKSSTDRKVIDIFNSTVSENFNLVYGIGLKTSYANYNLSGPYNQTRDIQMLVNNIINKIISTIDDNFLYRQALKAYINKDNIKQIRGVFSDILKVSFRELNRILLSAEFVLQNMIEEKMGKCPNGEYNVPYNKRATTEYRIMEYYNTKLLDLYKKLNEFV